MSQDLLGTEVLLGTYRVLWQVPCYEIFSKWVLNIIDYRYHCTVFRGTLLEEILYVQGRTWPLPYFHTTL
jgi:hypothetical protein